MIVSFTHRDFTALMVLSNGHVHILQGLLKAWEKTSMFANVIWSGSDTSSGPMAGRVRGVNAWYSRSVNITIANKAYTSLKLGFCTLCQAASHVEAD